MTDYDLSDYDWMHDMKLQLAFERSRRALERSVVVLRQTDALCRPKVGEIEPKE